MMNDNGSLVVDIMSIIRHYRPVGPHPGQRRGPVVAVACPDGTQGRMGPVGLPAVLMGVGGA